MSQTGYLITNLGTPASPARDDVRAYLKEFLLDPYVLTVPTPIRHLIVRGFILPFRPAKSAAAYESIWDPQGSPLLLHSEALKIALAERLQAPVALGMRYGTPNIESAIHELLASGVDQIVAIPLYPQHADSTTTTSVEEIRRHVPKSKSCTIVPAFYNASSFIEALAEVTKAHLPANWDHLLMSYHGLPELHMKRADPTGSHCMMSDDCCQTPSTAHSTCYRHQVFETSHALARAMGINAEQYSVSFQSRLGRGWLKPYTDHELAELPARGVKNLAVVCPAFVADNLETLEEMGLQGRETFLAAGGQSFHLIPCLNHEPIWVEALAKILHAASNQTDAANVRTSA